MGKRQVLAEKKNRLCRVANLPAGSDIELSNKGGRPSASFGLAVPARRGHSSLHGNIRGEAQLNHFLPETRTGNGTGARRRGRGKLNI